MTRYRVSFETADLITRALARIKQIEPIKAPRVATTVVDPHTPDDAIICSVDAAIQLT
jgi:type III restriction enzyme